jgi:hypothetical protein
VDASVATKVENSKGMDVIAAQIAVHDGGHDLEIPKGLVRNPKVSNTAARSRKGTTLPILLFS